MAAANSGSVGIGKPFDKIILNSNYERLQMHKVPLFDMKDACKAIEESAKETVDKLGVKSLLSLSWSPSNRK